VVDLTVPRGRAFASSDALSARHSADSNARMQQRVAFHRGMRQAKGARCCPGPEISSVEGPVDP